MNIKGLEQLADDILENRFCSEELPREHRLLILISLLKEVYWEGWHDNATGENYVD